MVADNAQTETKTTEPKHHLNSPLTLLFYAVLSLTPLHKYPAGTAIPTFVGFVPSKCFIWVNNFIDGIDIYGQ